MADERKATITLAVNEKISRDQVSLVKETMCWARHASLGRIKSNGNMNLPLGGKSS